MSCQIRSLGPNPPNHEVLHLQIEENLSSNITTSILEKIEENFEIIGKNAVKKFSN